MHFSILGVVSLMAAAFAPVAHANFDIYRVEAISPRGYVSVYWQAFEAEGSCSQTGSFADAIWPESSDVSGKKIGVRCKGSGCHASNPPGNIDQLEMHFGNKPLYHWTIYKDRGRSMVGLDGKTYGNCIVFPHGDFNCNDFLGVSWQGRRKFRCLTKFTAKQLAASKK